MAKHQLLDWDLPLQTHRSRDVLHSSWEISGGEARAYSHAELQSEGAAALGAYATIDQLPSIIANRLEQALHLQSLEEAILDLAERVRNLECNGRLAAKNVVKIQTFAPEPYQLLAPISVAIESDDHGDYIASFFDANISTSGETEQEAFDNLKNLILDIFDSLSKERPERLGPDPRRQLEVLRSFIRGA